ncbi:MAG: hypothetical protein ACHREM_04165 [Polyangiales bacterium]
MYPKTLEGYIRQRVEAGRDTIDHDDVYLLRMLDEIGDSCGVPRRHDRPGAARR